MFTTITPSSRAGYLASIASRHRTLHLTLLVLLSLLAGGTTLAAVERTMGPLTCPNKRDYWLGFPCGYDPQRNYWLVVSVHGHKGTGDGAKMFAWSSGINDYIVVAPTFPDGYQFLGQSSDKQLIDLFQHLRKQYHLHDRMFIHGFSGGSQFAHRFAMAHPEVVVGCSAHSGGTWGPETGKKALAVPFAVSCGLADTGNAGRQPRIVEANDYFQTLLTQGFCVKARFWEGVGHDIAPGVAPLSEECFVLATTGLYPGQSELVQAEIARVEAVVDSGDLDAAKKAVAALPKFRLPALARKSPARSKQPAVEQTAQRAAWVQAGLGGTCTLGQGGEMWIDDSNENTFGWNEGRAAEEARRAALLSMLRDRAKELKQRLAVLEKAAKAKPPEGR